MRQLIAFLVAGMLPDIAMAQDGSAWERYEQLPNFDRSSGSEIINWSTRDKIEYLLAKFRLDVAPAKPTDTVLAVGYRRREGVGWYRPYYTQSGPRAEPVFTPDDRYPSDCAALIELEAEKLLTADVRTALGISLRPVVAAGGYSVPMYDFPGGGSRYSAYVHDNREPLWQKESTQDGRRDYISQLQAGQEIGSTKYPVVDRSQTTGDWLKLMSPNIEYRTTKGVCRLNSYGGITVYVPIVLGSPRVGGVATAAPAPKLGAPSKPKSKGRDPVLTVTSPSTPEPAAPSAVIYKRGERPKPPEAPKTLPCPPGPTACVAGEGGPMTPEARAYMEKMRAYEISIREFEAKENADRAAVADLNTQMQNEYRAKQAATEKQRADALAARNAKIAQDQAAYNAKMRAHREETARLARQHEAAMNEWRRATAACLAGDKSQCAK